MCFHALQTAFVNLVCLIFSREWNTSILNNWLTFKCIGAVIIHIIRLLTLLSIVFNIRFLFILASLSLWVIHCNQWHEIIIIMSRFVLLVLQYILSAGACKHYIFKLMWMILKWNWQHRFFFKKNDDKKINCLIKQCWTFVFVENHARFDISGNNC